MAAAGDILTSVLTKCALAYLSGGVGSTEEQVTEVVDLLNETGKDLAARGEWQALLSSVSLGALPSDCNKISAVTVDAGGFARLVTAPETWAFLGQHAPAQHYYRIAGGDVEIVPAAAATVHYWSRNWSSAGETVTADGDAVYLPENCMVSGTFYRWKRKKGFPFDDEMAQHEAEVQAAQAADRGVR
jgi:hypothetical protein